MLCPSCQHRNLEENHFCGQCGCDLRKYKTIYPREGYDERDLPPVSEVESNVPHFRRDVPPLAATEYGPPKEETTRTPIATREPEPVEPPAREVVRSVAPEPSRETLRSYGSSTSILFNLDPKDTPKKETPKPAEPMATEPDKVPIAPTFRPEAIHGPSFLGLGDSGEPDFLDDLDEPSGHARRNWLLVALAIMVVLAVFQWRNIRATGMNFAGSIKLNLPTNDANAKPTAETAATDNHSENGPANNGKPEMSVNPVNGGTADTSSQNANSQSADAAVNYNDSNAPAQNGAAGKPPSDSLVSDQNDKAAKKDDNASAKPDTKNTDIAKNEAGAKLDEDSADNSDDNATVDAKPTKPAKKPAATHTAAKPVASSAGAEDLARANEASSPETAAKWLWASTSKGNLDAPVRLADMYATGRGVAKDCEQATVLLRSSARRGNPRASARLGMYYATGQCVEQDRTQAWHWLSLAHQRDPDSDWIQQYRERLWSQMSADERARAGNGPTSNASD